MKWNSGEFLKKMLAEFAAIVGLSEDREKEALNRDVSLDRDGGKPMTPRQVLVRATCTCDAGEKFSFQFPTDCWYLHPGGTQSEKYVAEFTKFMHELHSHGLATGRASFTLERVKDQ